jgi:voltage-gated potassium channel
VNEPPPHEAGRAGRHWLHAVAFTLALVGLVTLATGADTVFAATALATCGVGFGFFYLLFATGAHFGLVMANGLAVYVAMFTSFRDANFAQASAGTALVAFALPVLSFLGACVVGRGVIGHALEGRHHLVPRALPRLVRWLPAVIVVGTASFILPETGLDARHQGHALVGSMAVIALFVAIAARDIVLLLIDVAAVFENVAARAHRLVMPMLAFVTYYALVILVFTCLYRIAEMVLRAPQFRVHGDPRMLSFAEALYFSVVTLATVGYGDVVPEGMLVRALAAVQVVAGVLLLLFGFHEIVHAGRPRAAARRRFHPARRVRREAEPP